MGITADPHANAHVPNQPPAPSASGDGAAASTPSDAAGERILSVFQTAGNELLGTARALLGNADDANEAYQEAFLKCWQRRDESAHVANLRGFAFTVLVNLCRDERRRQRRKPAGPLEVDVAGDGRGRAMAQPLGADIERRELVGQVRAAIDELRPEDREVFLLRQNAGMAFADIAELLGIPEGTAKTRMRKALHALRSVLDRSPAFRE